MTRQWQVEALDRNSWRKHATCIELMVALPVVYGKGPLSNPEWVTLVWATELGGLTSDAG